VVDEELLPIGVVSRRTGLTIKAIRFYADRGIVLPAGRNVAGHRVFDTVGVARLELVHTLRDLGLDLPTIKRILDRERPLAEVAAAQARAIAEQIEVLRMRQAVLSRLASHESTHEELQLMVKAGKLSHLEQQELINEFTASVFADNRTDPDVVGIARSLRPGLPDDPSISQLEAWVEMTELLQDNDFRRTIRQLVDQYVADRAAGGGVPGRDLAALICHEAQPAIAAGIHPRSSAADPVARAVIARFRTTSSSEQAPTELLDWLAAANDPRRERYLRLLSIINEWAAPESLAAVFAWTTDAVRARLAG